MDIWLVMCGKWHGTCCRHTVHQVQHCLIRWVNILGRMQVFAERREVTELSQTMCLLFSSDMSAVSHSFYAKVSE